MHRKCFTFQASHAPHPQVQPLTLFYSIFKGKLSLWYTFYWKIASFTCVLKNAVTAATGLSSD